MLMTTYIYSFINVISHQIYMNGEGEQHNFDQNMSVAYSNEICAERKLIHLTLSNVVVFQQRNVYCIKYSNQ